jgi:hypothetical protein
LLLCSLFIGMVFISAEYSRAESLGDLSYRDAPRGILEVWLRFHESDLCQDNDISFEFEKSGMSIRGMVEDERSFQRFQDMVNPLRTFYSIQLSVTRPEVEEKTDREDDRDPPPSLWENYELRSNLGDPLALMLKDRPDFEEHGINRSPDQTLKYRLWIYAAQTMDWNRRMERLAGDLLILSRVASDPAIDPELRNRTNAVRAAHAQNLGKLITKLSANLAQAFPRFKSKDRVSAEKAASPKDPVNCAIQISETAHKISEGVLQFVHPEQFTVGLDELRQPALLESLKNLSRLNSDFQKEIGKFVQSSGQ